MTRAEFRVVARLVLEHARRRPGRVALTTLSTIAAACSVVWVVSGYDSLVGQFGAMNQNYMGRYEVLILPTAPEMPDAAEGRTRASLPDRLIERIRRDPAVAVADSLFETRLAIRPASRPAEVLPPSPAPDAPRSGPILMGGMSQLKGQARTPTLVETGSTEPLHPIHQGRWSDPSRSGSNEAAVTRDTAELWDLKLGDELAVAGSGRPRGEIRLKVVAIVEQPKRLPTPRFMVGLPPSRDPALRTSPAGNAVYVPMALAVELAGAPAKASFAGVVLKPGKTVSEVLAGWPADLAASSPPAMARTLEVVGEEVGNSTTSETVRAQACSASGISLLAALFLIFTTLSLGVDERIRHPDAPVAYEIAGVVSMPGWRWMSKVGFRRGRAAGLMFSGYDQVRRDFDTGRPAMFRANMDGIATEAQIQAAIEPIAARNFDPKRARPGPADRPAGGGASPPAGPAVTLRSVTSVRAQIRGRPDAIIWALGELTLVTLAVTSIGVVNAVLSSIRARRWEMGVLRSLGVTRSGLSRLIVAEAILVGVVACILSLGFGALAGYCRTGITRHLNIRGGRYTPLILPWARLAIGYAATLGLCLLAALWPPFTTGRTEPLRLLQDGRASA